MFEAVSQLADEHAELETRLADPSVHADQSLARRLNQRYAELSAIVRAHHEWTQLGDDLQAAAGALRRGRGRSPSRPSSWRRRAPSPRSGCATC